MRSTHATAWRALATSGIIITAGLAATASASAAAGPIRSGPVPATQRDGAQDYWTPERMRNAKPVDSGIAPKAGSQPSSAGNTATGPPGVAGGTSAGLPTNGDPQASVFSEPLSSPMPSGGTSYPGPHTSWNYFGPYVRYPVSTMGKLFFTQNGGNFVCSGTVTYGGNASVKNTVWTAGHCVSDGTSTFNTSAVFCPSYNANGVNPQVGCWNATSFGTTTQWHNNGDFDRDVGVVFVAGTGSVKSSQIVDAVGALGFGWNFARDQHFMDFGYPSDPPYNGTKLVVSATEHRYDRQGGSGPASLSIGSSHTPGASGGGWILGFNGQGGFINSVNSHYYTSGANGNEGGKQIQGPYSDTFICGIWDVYTNWPGTC